MALRETRAWIANQGSYYLCALPQVQLAEGEVESAWEALERGEATLQRVYRASPSDEPEQIAAGYARQGQVTVETGDKGQSWTERRLIVRSLRHAQAAEESLRTRVAQAQEQVTGLHQRGRGRQRFEEIEEWRQAATAIVQRHHVAEFLWLRYDQQCSSRPVRADRHREAGIKVDRHATVAVRVDEAALESAVSRLGWRVYVTKQPSEQLSLEQAVLAYRSAYLVERS
jgi:transposase